MSTDQRLIDDRGTLAKLKESRKFIAFLTTLPVVGAILYASSPADGKLAPSAPSSPVRPTPDEGRMYSSGGVGVFDSGLAPRAEFTITATPSDGQWSWHATIDPNGNPHAAELALLVGDYPVASTGSIHPGGSVDELCAGLIPDGADPNGNTWVSGSAAVMSPDGKWQRLRTPAIEVKNRNCEPARGIGNEARLGTNTAHGL